MICPFVFDEPEKVAAQDESVATERRIARAIANKRFNPFSSFRSFFFFNYTRDQLSFQWTTAPKTEYGRITKNAVPETVQKDGTIRVRCPQTRSKKAPKFLVTAPFSATREARYCRIAFLSDLQEKQLFRQVERERDGEKTQKRRGAAKGAAPHAGKSGINLRRYRYTSCRFRRDRPTW